VSELAIACAIVNILRADCMQDLYYPFMLNIREDSL